FEHHDAVADIDAGCGADAANEPGAQVADDVAVQVTHHQNVELLRLGHHLHAAVVDNDLLGLHLGKFRGGPAERFEEKAIRHFEDVCLVHAMDELAALSVGPIEGETEKTPASRLGHDLDALHDARHDFVLDGGVEVFG